MKVIKILKTILHTSGEKKQLEDDIDAANEIIEYSPNKHIEEEE